MKLSEHFHLLEFMVSDSHPEMLQNAEPSADILDHLKLLCEFGLEPIRRKWGTTIITSGYRTPELNKAVGGVLDSQHTTGRACDFKVLHGDMINVFVWCQRELEWPGELILYRKRGHIHLGLPQLNVKSDKLILNS